MKCIAIIVFISLVVFIAAEKDSSYGYPYVGPPQAVPPYGHPYGSMSYPYRL